jgi:hypothetical protein
MMILFFQSLLEDIRLEQEHATVLFEDSNGALLMANAQQPTIRGQGTLILSTLLFLTGLNRTCLFYKKYLLMITQQMQGLSH